MAPLSGSKSTPREALQLFKIDNSSTLQELNSAYKRLANKYHPDRNPGKESWAHKAMTKINAAYDAAVDFLGALQYKKIESRLNHEIQAHEDFMAVFTNVADRVVDGVFTYFQYGLSNPHQRTAGIARLRYRQSLKLISTAIDRLVVLNAPNRVDAETRDIFVRFAKAFLRCMQLDRVFSPSSPREERLAYRHYRTGNNALDTAIRRGFFREELSPPGELASPQALAIGMNEYMTLLTRHRESSWIVETVQRLQLLESYEELLKHAERYDGIGL